MSNRQRLPDRRAPLFFDFQSMGMRFTASVSHFPDGRIAELFVDNHKAGSAIGTLVRDAAIIFSLPLQRWPCARTDRRSARSNHREGIMMAAPSPKIGQMIPIIVGNTCRGFLYHRRYCEFEVFTIDEKSVGTFPYEKIGGRRTF
jgi:hypothetical protein